VRIRSSYLPEIITTPDEIESEEEFVMADNGVTQWENWRDPERPLAIAVPVMSVRLAADK
jgi:hypothetical protein